jgi:hypothetical protein
MAWAVLEFFNATQPGKARADHHTPAGLRNADSVCGKHGLTNVLRPATQGSRRQTVTGNLPGCCVSDELRPIGALIKSAETNPQCAVPPRGFPRQSAGLPTPPS